MPHDLQLFSQTACVEVVQFVCMSLVDCPCPGLACI